MKTLKLTFLGLSALTFAAVASPVPPGSDALGRAQLESKSGSKATGTVELATDKKGLLVRVDISGVTPGKHGMHVHEKGDCSAADASSAGGHFNPTGAKHGTAVSGVGHIGDFGNIVADKNGVAKVEFSVPQPVSKGFPGYKELIGKSIVLHEKEDDLKTQPTGNSGGRIACGVIVAAPASAP